MRNRVPPGLIAALSSCYILAVVPTAHAASNGDELTGVNIAGAEFNGKALPGVAGKDYFYPKAATFDHFAAKGMNVIRLPFRWERIQPTLNGELDAAEYRRLADTVHQARAKK